jgi:hypothetical protein
VGLAHQLRVDVSIAISMLPAWVRGMLRDRDPMRSRTAKAEIAERISAVLERRFRITCHGSDDRSESARPPEGAAP